MKWLTDFFAAVNALTQSVREVQATFDEANRQLRSRIDPEPLTIEDARNGERKPKAVKR